MDQDRNCLSWSGSIEGIEPRYHWTTGVDGIGAKSEEEDQVHFSFEREVELDTGHLVVLSGIIRVVGRFGTILDQCEVE